MFVIKSAVTVISAVTLPSVLGSAVELSLHQTNVYHVSARGYTAVHVPPYEIVCDADPLRLPPVPAV